MSKYLDETGLSYFWSKLKTLLAAKADKSFGSSNANKTVITDSSGNFSTRKLVDGYSIVNSLPSSNIDENIVYLIASSDSGGGGGGGTVSVEEVFIAVYGTTTHADVLSAFNDGKLIFAKRTSGGVSVFAPLLTYNNTFYFSYCDGTGSLGLYTLASNNSWSNSSVNVAPLASPALTGTPTAPTASSGTNTTQIATTAFVQSICGDVEAALEALL